VGSGLFFCLSTNSGDKAVKKLGYAVNASPKIIKEQPVLFKNLPYTHNKQTT